MIWLASLFMTIFLLGGVARLVSFFRNAATAPGSQRRLSRRSLLSVGVVNIAFASAGLYCLFARIFDPTKILITVFLVTSLVEISLTMMSKVGSGAR
jgi:uncharacterized membrane protein (DUF485 family)